MSSTADPSKLQAALAIVVKDIQLYWTAGGPRKWRFDRGVITLGDSLLPSLPSPRGSMKELLTFTEADFDRPLTRHEELAAKVTEMFDGTNPVRTIDVSKALDRDYGTVKTQLHIAAKRGLLTGVPRKGWLPIRAK